jgi:hypothetical protein
MVALRFRANLSAAIGIASWVSATVVGLASQPRSRIVRDLTAETPRTVMRLRAAPAPTVDATRPAWPIRIVNAALNREEYRARDPVLFEVAIEATEAVTLPWSVACDQIDPEFDGSPRGSRRMTIMLVHEQGGVDTAAFVTLCGSELVTDSLRRVEPGSIVVFRAADKWQMAYDPGMPSARSLSAVVQFREGAVQLLRLVRKENFMTVKVLP